MSSAHHGQAAQSVRWRLSLLLTLPALLALVLWGLAPALWEQVSAAVFDAIEQAFGLVPDTWQHLFERWLAALEHWRRASPWLFGTLYLSTLVTLSALSLPGAAVLLPLAGVHWGTALGTLIALAGSTLGACLSFAAARRFGREPLSQRFGNELAALNRHLHRHGLLSIVLMRMTPIIPYPLLNPLLGLTTVPLSSYSLGTAVGMLAGTAGWVFLGEVMQHWDGQRPAWFAELLLALTTLGLLPLMGMLLQRLADRPIQLRSRVRS